MSCFESYMHVLLGCMCMIANVCTSLASKNGLLSGNQLFSRPFTCRSPTCRYVKQSQQNCYGLNKSGNRHTAIPGRNNSLDIGNVSYAELYFWYTFSLLHITDNSRCKSSAVILENFMYIYIWRKKKKIEPEAVWFCKLSIWYHMTTIFYFSSDAPQWEICMYITTKSSCYWGVMRTHNC